MRRLRRALQSRETRRRTGRGWRVGHGQRSDTARDEDASFAGAGQGFEFLGYRGPAGVCPREPNKLKDAIRRRMRRNPRQPRAHHRRSQPVAAPLVRLLQARPSARLPIHRRIDPACRRPLLKQRMKRSHIGQRPQSASSGPMPTSESTAFRTSRSLGRCEAVSMKNAPTGEPYAGKPPVRFGRGGGRKAIPTTASPTCRPRSPHGAATSTPTPRLLFDIHRTAAWSPTSCAPSAATRS